jgi:hypothetical protein
VLTNFRRKKLILPMEMLAKEKKMASCETASWRFESLRAQQKLGSS